MKRFGIFLALTLAACNLASGQAGGGQGPMMNIDPSMRRERATHQVDERVKFLQKQLQLNSDQKNQVRRILENEQRQALEARQDSSISDGERRAKIAAVRRSTDQQVTAVLNDEQKKKYQQLQTTTPRPE